MKVSVIIPSRNERFLVPTVNDVLKTVMHDELMRSLDDMSNSLQMLIQRVEQVHNESLDRAKVYIECNDEILKALRRVEGKVEGVNA